MNLLHSHFGTRLAMLLAQHHAAKVAQETPLWISPQGLYFVFYRFNETCAQSRNKPALQNLQKKCKIFLDRDCKSIVVSSLGGLSFSHPQPVLYQCGYKAFAMLTLEQVLSDKARILKAYQKAQKCYLERGHTCEQKKVLTVQLYAGIPTTCSDITAFYRAQGLSSRKAREYAISDWQRIQSHELVAVMATHVTWNTEEKVYDVSEVQSYDLRKKHSAKAKSKPYKIAESERKGLTQTTKADSVQGVTSGFIPETAQAVIKSKVHHTFRVEPTPNNVIVRTDRTRVTNKERIAELATKAEQRHEAYRKNNAKIVQKVFDIFPVEA